MKISLVDLKRQYESIKTEIHEAINLVFEDSVFVGGERLKAFEENFAKASGADFCIGVNSGTSALHIALMALKISEEAEVIVPANTFFATPEAVSLAGAKPVFVDCEPRFYNINPELIESKITEKTRAIIAVNLYGQPAELDKIKDIADKYNLSLIEDCAQAHLAKLKNKPVGTFGICGCFSFYPGKNLGAYGEGGAVITNDKNFADKIRVLREHGSRQKYYHECIGHNYRLETLQAAMLDVKLKYLSCWTELRREKVKIYRELLKENIFLKLPEENEKSEHVYHLFVVRAEKRNELIKFLAQKGIIAGIHYPVPCHLQKAYEFLGHKRGDFPVSEKYSKEIISLPLFPELTDKEIKYICLCINEFYGQKNISL